MENKISRLIGINEYLYSNIPRDDWENFTKNGVVESDQLYNFLASSGFSERSENALKILSNILDIQHKKPFYKILKHIVDIENGIQIFTPHIRDHISHSVYVYLLGKLFINKLPRPINYENFEFEWKLTSLLHDLGNPLNLFADSMITYIGEIEKVGETLSPIHTSFKFKNISDLVPRGNKKINSFSIIKKRLKKKWNVNINIQEIYNNNLNQGKIEHGIFGALLMLKIIDGLYYKNNPHHYKTDFELDYNHEQDTVGWGRDHFDQEIVSAASAISIHNLLDNLDNPIDYMNTPLPFLLTLCDTVQEWDRFSIGQRVYDPFSVTIHFTNDHPSFHFQLPKYKINNIQTTFNKLSIHGKQIEIY